jgi:hypothetical protein
MAGQARQLKHQLTQPATLSEKSELKALAEVLMALPAELRQ